MNHVGQDVTVLLTEEQIQTRIREMAKEITAYYQDHDLVLIGVLKGCFLFLADLSRHIDLPLCVDFLGLSSYGDSTKTSGVVKITKDLSDPIANKDVLVVEDIVDTGLTMKYLLNNLTTRMPRSIRICSLLSKPANIIVPVDIRYLGFEIPDRFVIGYGLDYGGKYRNLPYIGYLTSPGE